MSRRWLPLEKAIVTCGPEEFDLDIMLGVADWLFNTQISQISIELLEKLQVAADLLSSIRDAVNGT